VAKRGMDAAGAVGLAALGVDRADLLAQPLVGEVTIRGRPPLPGVKARAADAEHTAKRLHGMLGLPRGDEPKDAHRLSPSLAKKAAAFFKISRSSRSTRTSRRSRRSSSRSSVLTPGCSPASTAACFDPQSQRLRRDTEVMRDLSQRAAAPAIQRHESGGTPRSAVIAVLQAGGHRFDPGTLQKSLQTDFCVVPTDEITGQLHIYRAC
jgi:hypothetical protein